MKQKSDPYEEIMKQASKDNHDDTIKYSVRYRDKEASVQDKRRDIEMREDPDNPGVFVPYSRTILVYDLDDNGNLFGSLSNAGGCAFGCIVRADSLIKCSRCQSNICTHHAIFITRERAYCKKGLCRITGNLIRIMLVLYQIFGFFARSVFRSDADSTSEESLFSQDSYTQELADSEKE